MIFLKSSLSLFVYFSLLSTLPSGHMGSHNLVHFLLDSSFTLLACEFIFPLHLFTIPHKLFIHSFELYIFFNYVPIHNYFSIINFLYIFTTLFKLLYTCFNFARLFFPTFHSPFIDIQHHYSICSLLNESYFSHHSPHVLHMDGHIFLQFPQL